MLSYYTQLTRDIQLKSGKLQSLLGETFFSRWLLWYARAGTLSS